MFRGYFLGVIFWVIINSGNVFLHIYAIFMEQVKHESKLNYQPFSVQSPHISTYNLPALTIHIQ